MKKIISLVLIVLLLSGFVCYAEDASVDLEALKNYEIFIGDEQGLRLSDNITKGEFLKMVACSMSYVDLTVTESFSVDVSTGEEVSTLKTFSDLESSHWAYPYVLYLDVMGFDVADEDTNVLVDKTITYAECLTYILKATGYEIKDSFDENMITATHTGISKGLSVANDDIITRETAAIIISNAINVPIRAVSGFNAQDGSTNYVILDGKDGKELRTLKTSLDLKFN